MAAVSLERTEILWPSFVCLGKFTRIQIFFYYPPSSVVDKVEQMSLSAGDNLEGTEVMGRKYHDEKTL